MSELFPNVEKLINHIIKNHIHEGGYAVVKAGQRSGKTLLALEIARRADIELVLWNTYSPVHLGEVVRIFRGQLHPSTLQRYNPNDLDPRAKQLVVIDEAFWTPRSYDIFSYVREQRVPVLVIGSRGSEYDKDERWSLVPGYSFNTWDLNPSITMDYIIQQRGLTPKTVRDYFAF